MPGVYSGNEVDDLVDGAITIERVEIMSDLLLPERHQCYSLSAEVHFS